MPHYHPENHMRRHDMWAALAESANERCLMLWMGSSGGGIPNPLNPLEDSPARHIAYQIRSYDAVPIPVPLGPAGASEDNTTYGRLVSVLFTLEAGLPAGSCVITPTTILAGAGWSAVTLDTDGAAATFMWVDQWQLLSMHGGSVAPITHP